jgi:hypothetical protein
LQEAGFFLVPVFPLSEGFQADCSRSGFLTSHFLHLFTIKETEAMQTHKLFLVGHSWSLIQPKKYQKHCVNVGFSAKTQRYSRILTPIVTMHKFKLAYTSIVSK